MKNDNDSRFSRELVFTRLLPSDYTFLNALYEAAFPTNERRHWKQLESMWLLPNMQIVIARQETTPVGFAIYWQIEEWYFLEHLAIHPHYEGKGYGSKMMRWLLLQSQNRLLLEAELPLDELSQRRIRFYEKLDFEIAPFPYQQPPYRKGEATAAMHILSVPVITDVNEYKIITHAIRQQVFEAFY